LATLAAPAVALAAAPYDEATGGVRSGTGALCGGAGAGDEVAEALGACALGDCALGAWTLGASALGTCALASASWDAFAVPASTGTGTAAEPSGKAIAAVLALEALLNALGVPAIAGMAEAPAWAAETPVNTESSLPRPLSLPPSSAEGATGAPSIGAAPRVGTPGEGSVPAELPNTGGEGLPEGGNGAPPGLPPAGFDESPFLADFAER
jgi:hypothetical protein